MIRFRKPMPWCFTLLFSLALLSVVCSGLHAEKAGLSVYFLDVGQGDSIVITSPEGKVAIIDAGMGGAGYKKKDKAKTVIIPFLKSKGIKKLDTAIMTHADFDHVGGFVYLFKETKAGSEYPLEIKEFLDPGQPHTTNLYQEVLRAVKERPEVKYRIAKRGDLIDLGKGVRAEAVAPDHIYDDPNNSSIVIKLTYGKISFLFTGDAETESEGAMIQKYGPALKSTVLKVGHHGSVKSSSSAFLNQVKPEVAVISVGEKNKFGLPFKEPLQRLEATGAKIYRTDYQGMITVTTDGETYKVTTEREAPPLEKRWDTVKVLKESEKININTASEGELETLPLIGKVKAHSIALGRPYASIDDLRRVKGIGAKTMEKIRPLVTVDGSGKAAASAPGGTSIGSITPQDVGKKVPTLIGVIRTIRVFKDDKGRTLMITDGTGSIDVLIWKGLYEAIPQREKLEKGARIKVKGKVGSYQGKLQIQPDIAEDIQIMEPEKEEKPAGKSAEATPPAAAPTALPQLKQAA